jgi:DNA (cytosine-5)-methyltransferase 1
MTLWFCHYNPAGYRPGIRRFNLDTGPAPTILAGGIHGDNLSHYWLEEDGIEGNRPVSDKPPYCVPSLAEIAALPWNGYSVISTFSGCGGSCLGFEMAGFRILWASEFIPAAQETYRVNHPDTLLDTRDIRTVQPEEILAAVGKQPGEIDVLEGSPPCASFSTAGKREAGWGKVKAYSDTKQRTDDLFFEFARLLRGVQPKVFVAENVSGLIKGTAKGYFLEILAALKACGYTVQARLLDAQWLGVPQTRQRLIFQGVRKDLGLEPVFPKPLPYRYSVREALPWVSGLRWESGGQHGNKVFAVDHEPCQTIQAGGGGSQLRYAVEAETDISRYAIGQEWDRLGPGEKSSKYLNLIKPELDRPCPTICQSHGNPSLAGVVHPTQKRKFTIAELKRLCGFPDDFVLTGSYTQQWERLGRAVPPVMMFHVARILRDEILCKLPLSTQRTRPGNGPSTQTSRGSSTTCSRARSRSTR